MKKAAKKTAVAGRVRIISKPTAGMAAAGGKKIAALHDNYAATFASCPDDYASLKAEAVYLGKLSGHSFLLMAQRLKKIRDLSLYEEDGYGSFKAFIDGEMTLGASSVYGYMDILEAFGEKRLMAEPGIEYTKLRPAVPILRAAVKGLPRAKIRKQFIEKAKTSTRKEIAETARDLKDRYGLTPRSSAVARSRIQDSAGEGGQASLDLAPAIRAFLAAVPAGALTGEQKQQLRELVKELTAIIVRPRR